MRRIGLVAAIALACSGQPKTAAKPDSTAKKVTPSPPPSSSVALTPPDSMSVLPPMPPYPAAGRGRMAVVSAGPPGSEPITRDWPAAAGRCDAPARLLVKSEQPGAGGTLVLVESLRQTAASYPVSLADTARTSPAAQVGVQVYSKMGPLAYQALEGLVELNSVGKTVSGRFGVTVREVNRKDRIRYAGSFQEIPVVALDSARCARPGAPVPGGPD